MKTLLISEKMAKRTVFGEFNETFNKCRIALGRILLAWLQHCRAANASAIWEAAEAEEEEQVDRLELAEISTRR